MLRNAALPSLPASSSPRNCTVPRIFGLFLLIISSAFLLHFAKTWSITRNDLMEISAFNGKSLGKSIIERHPALKNVVSKKPPQPNLTGFKPFNVTWNTNLATQSEPDDVMVIYDQGLKTGGGTETVTANVAEKEQSHDDDTDTSALVQKPIVNRPRPQPLRDVGGRVIGGGGAAAAGAAAGKSGVGARDLPQRTLVRGKTKQAAGTAWEKRDFDYDSIPVHYVKADTPAIINAGQNRLNADLPMDFLPPQLQGKTLCDPTSNTMTIDKDYMICFQSALAPFAHPQPKFAEQKDRDLFLMQPRNVESLDINWMNTSYETCFHLRKDATAIHGEVLSGHMWSFQHFHDNALGIIYQNREAFNMLDKLLHPCTLPHSMTRLPPRGDLIVSEEWDLIDFPNSMPQAPHPGQIANEIYIRRFIRDHDQERTHPEAVQWLLSKFPDNKLIHPKKVVWISRQGSSQARQFRNEPRATEYLKKHLSGFELFNPSQEKITSVQGLRDRLGDACIIIGVHGGQMYNQFFASRKTAVLELMPVQENGWITGQTTLKVGPFAQRAIWHNANTIRQPYWRVHFLAISHVGFDLDQDALDRIIQTVKMAGCKP